MGKPSTIDRLPEDILEKLQQLLRDPRVTQCKATDQINAILEQEGHAERVSKSGVNRYWLKMEKAGAKLRQSREIAHMWINRVGAAPQGQVGHLVNEILRTLSFDMALMLQEGEINEDTAPATVKMLKGLSLTMQRLEKAASDNVKREKEIRDHERESAKKDAVNALEHIADADTIKKFRKQFL